MNIEGVLEVDVDRGVIYFHQNEPSDVPTLLRICNLPDLTNFGKELFDITHMVGPKPRKEYIPLRFE